MSRLKVVSAREAGWDAVETVFRTEASARNCWCQFHVLTNAAAARTDRDSRRAMLSDQIQALDPPRGLIAFEGDLPIGWCGVEPRVRLHHVLASRLVVKASPCDPGDPRVWSIYCILVPPEQRGRGVAAALLRAAIAHAIDTIVRGGVLPPGFSTGTVGMFAREGFRAVAALPSGRTLVHRTALTGRTALPDGLT